MKKPGLLAALALLAAPLAACDQLALSSPGCTIIGRVAVEGLGIDGVSVTLSTGQSSTTSGGGHFRFDNVRGGTVTLTLAGLPADATFDLAPAALTMACDGLVTIDFSGSYIRTSRIRGTVTVERAGLSGVTVVLSGVFHTVTTTDGDGGYAFGSLRAGDYSVAISGFDTAEIRFPYTDTTLAVIEGELSIVSFDGAHRRTAAQGVAATAGLGR